LQQIYSCFPQGINELQNHYDSNSTLRLKAKTILDKKQFKNTKSEFKKTP